MQAGTAEASLEVARSHACPDPTSTAIRCSLWRLCVITLSTFGVEVSLHTLRRKVRGERLAGPLLRNQLPPLCGQHPRPERPNNKSSANNISPRRLLKCSPTALQDMKMQRLPAKGDRKARNTHTLGAAGRLLERPRAQQGPSTRTGASQETTDQGDGGPELCSLQTLWLLGGATTAIVDFLKPQSYQDGSLGLSLLHSI